MYRSHAGSKARLFSMLAMALYFLQATPVISSTVYGSGNSSCAEWTEAGESGTGRGRAEEWALGYQELALQSGILREEHEDPARFLRWFDLMGVQRHLKAAGIFARLNHRDDKPGYLGDIPRTLGYVVDVAGRHADLEWLGEFVRDRVLAHL